MKAKYKAIESAVYKRLLANQGKFAAKRKKQEYASVNEAGKVRCYE